MAKDKVFKVWGYQEKIAGHLPAAELLGKIKGRSLGAAQAKVMKKFPKGYRKFRLIEMRDIKWIR
jgi:hypothetical protein